MNILHIKLCLSFINMSNFIKIFSKKCKFKHTILLYTAFIFSTTLTFIFFFLIILLKLTVLYLKYKIINL